MTIGIDISQIVYEGTGVARFTNGLVEAILTYDTRHTWVFFASLLRQDINPQLKKRILEKGHRLVQVPFPPTALSFLWNDLHTVKVETFTGNLDLFISSDWTEPPTNCKKATIIHDLVFKRYPETVDKKILATQEKRLNHVQKESDYIITDSHASKQDICHYFDISEEKIHVIYPGLHVAQPSENVQAVTLQTFNILKPYMLTVGKIEPRKNLKKLIEAYNNLNQTIQNIPQLIIVGQQGWEHIEELKNTNIRLLGHVTDEELYALYAKSLFFIFPSIWEGFGYPALEAMQLGVPTALSQTSSLGEIGKDAAYLFDPHDVQSIEQALQEMIQNEQLRNELRTKGRERAKQFTWETYYNELIEVLSI